MINSFNNSIEKDEEKHPNTPSKFEFLYNKNFKRAVSVLIFITLSTLAIKYGPDLFKDKDEDNSTFNENPIEITENIEINNNQEIINDSKLDFILSPTDMTLAIDGGEVVQISNGQELELPSGDHTLLFSRDGFKSSTKKISIDTGEKINKIVILDPITTEAEIISLESQDIIDKYSGKLMTEEIKEINEANPILKHIPIESRFYTITTGKSQKYDSDITKIGIYINTNQPGEVIESGIETHLNSLGFSLNDFEEVYWTIEP